ncbi:MAG TPA: hypothetical protein VND64_08855 [Pirellulales bacterium]|nr:hypothetical protein [Pirellulales bacterium]
MNTPVRSVAVFVGLAGMANFALPESAPNGLAPSNAYLLKVSEGQTFTDIGSDDKTKPVPVDANDLSKGLKVVFAPGDTVGDRISKVESWEPFEALRMSVVNPSNEAVKLVLNLFHADTKNYGTRVVQPLVFPPGEHEIVTPVKVLANVNGSSHVLSDVRKWYLADEDNAGPTLVFRDIWLEGRTPQTRATEGGVVLTGKYRIRGRVGTLEVDLTLEPEGAVPAGAAAKGNAASKVPVADRNDSARLQRIRTAKMPSIVQPIAFDTPAADAICSALEIFPPDNPWNTVVDDWPVHPNSRNIVASAGADKPFRYNPDMAFVLVPPNQKRVRVKLGEYQNESDKGPYPVPDETPIEGWPVNYPGMTLIEVQRKKEEGDRHAIVVDPSKRMLFEFYQLRKTDEGWTASGAAIFDLKSNKLRPDGWTSTDAAGLPIFPAVVRYDELQRGVVEHAMRVTVTKTRRAYVYPATHFASRLTDKNLPRMGERFRLRKDFDHSGFSPEVQAILKGLKKYGMYVADNGMDWAISVAPDRRISNFAEELRKIKGSDFEVVEAPTGYRPPD